LPPVGNELKTDSAFATFFSYFEVLKTLFALSSPSVNSTVSENIIMITQLSALFLNMASATSRAAGDWATGFHAFLK
jgi:hypothetical protein